MTSCLAHPWGDATGLACTRLDGHDDGHTFAATDGSFVPDRHGEDAA